MKTKTKNKITQRRILSDKEMVKAIRESEKSGRIPWEEAKKEIDLWLSSFKK